MQISDEMKALEALARAYDHEEAACMGEPSPWVSADAEGDDEWKAERIVAARAGLDAYRYALSLPVQPVAGNRLTLPDGVEIGEFRPCIIVNDDMRITEAVFEDVQYKSVPVFDGIYHYMDKYLAVDDGRLVGFAVWMTRPLTTSPVPPTKGPEDDLIAAREAAAQAYEADGIDGIAQWIRDGENDTFAVKAALLALRSRPASALPVVGDGTKVYLASRYSRFPEMQQVRAELEAAGYTVTSRWINGGHELTKEGSTEAHEAERVRYAQEDFADLLDADMVVSFTEIPRETKTRGGRHVEHGMALALGKRTIVVGYRENVFHCLPQCEFFPDWPSARSALTPSVQP